MGEGGTALGVVMVGLFLCPLYVSLALTDFCRNPDIENHEDRCWSTGGHRLGDLLEEHATKKHIMEG